MRIDRFGSACLAIGAALVVGLCTAAEKTKSAKKDDAKPKTEKKAKINNLLKNGGFEKVSFKQTQAWRKQYGRRWMVPRRHKMPLDWLLNSGAPGEVQLETAKPHAGKNAINLYAGVCDAQMYQIVSADAGQKFHVSLWARGRGWLHVRLYYYSRGKHLGATDRWTDPIKVFLKPKWTEYKAEVTMPADKDDLTSVGFALCTMPSSEATIDDVVMALPPPKKSAPATQPKAK